MPTADPIVIVSAARTPMGAFLGGLSSLSAAQLGAAAIAAALERGKVDPGQVERILMGCVLTAGQGQAPARQAALAAGLPLSAAATTVNKMCGSGMQAMTLGHDMLVAGSAELVVTGGMESMSNAPYLLARHRTGARIGHDRLIDSLQFDGLEDAYEAGKPMGAFAEETAQRYGFTREALDAYAERGLVRALEAIKAGTFEREIAPVSVTTKMGQEIVDIDEQPLRADPLKIGRLKPAFHGEGVITAASSASVSDGAAALVLTRASIAKRLKLSPLAVIAGHAEHAQAPNEFATAPIPAMRKALARAGWSVADVDLFEVNEAFAVVPMAAMQALGVAPERMNIHGGACALGHPLGASGARIVCTLLAALHATGGRRGVAALCIGGGEATAMAIELL